MMAALSEATNTFTLNVFKKINEEDTSQNIFYSPLSLYCALAMVLDGANGNTAAQIQQVLSLNKGTDVHQSIQSFLAEANKSGSQCLLRIANRLFGEKTCDFIPSFKESCQRFYHSNMEELDFANAPEEARMHINMWVEEKTEGKIAELLASDALNSLTSLVLVNAIYFKGKWEKQFDKRKTTEKMFKISKLQKTITYGKLSDWTHEDMVEMYDVQLYLSRFKLEESYDLRSTLSSMGMSDAFSTNHADFSGMTERKKKSIFVRFFHKSFVEVNEEGIEAAASTADEFSLRMKLPSMTFNVDHPFLFFIKHNKTNSILFYGRVCSP